MSLSEGPNPEAGSSRLPNALVGFRMAHASRPRKGMPCPIGVSYFGLR
jgi:hypothetical protein